MYSPGMEANGQQLSKLPMPSSRGPASPRRKLLHVWYPSFYVQCLIFVAATQGVPTDHLVLLAKDTCVPAHGSIQLESSFWLATTFKALHGQHIETHPQFLCEIVEDLWPEGQSSSLVCI